jgi:SAM-dependent methyltransferase
VPAEYDARAARYDETRSASASTLGALLRALGPGDGRSLLDIGGGTGNYAVALARAGFAVTVVDVSSAMLGRAAEKLGTGAAVLGDALRLPVRDAAFDCAASVNVSHHVSDWRRHLDEARRVLRRAFAVQVNTRENLAAHWIFEYFPEAREHTLALHPRADEVLAALRAAGFARVRGEGFAFEDADDGTFEALKHWPETYLDETYRRNTTFFRRMPPGVERRGVERLRADHESGALRDVIERYAPAVARAGDSTVFAGWR